MNDYTIEAKERFRKKMREYFYLIGDSEAFEDIQTESEERLVFLSILMSDRKITTGTRIELNPYLTRYDNE